MQVDPNAPSRPALRYPGSKFQLAPWILAHMPSHESYCEAFAGGAAVLLRKRRSALEAVNDLSGDVTNFFRQLRERPDQLIHAITWTPWSREEHDLCRLPCGDDLERARRLYFRCWSSIRPFDDHRSFRRQPLLSRGRNGGRAPMTQAAKQFMRVEHLWKIASRLRGVTIENMDALDFIRRYDYEEALHYIDPPYPFSTRTQRKHYPHDNMTDDDHRALAAVLHACTGMVMLSGYRCDLYDELYGDWRRVDRSARIDGGGSATESLWLSPLAVERRRHGDLPLFS